MKDLREWSDDELALMALNDEYFYSEINHEAYFYALIDEEFIYTGKQLDALKDARNLLLQDGVSV
jgi:hypothetical protein